MQPYVNQTTQEEDDVPGIITDLDILSKPCEPVMPEEFGGDELKDTILKMVKSMAYNGGVGLAANQIGICKRIFVTNLDAIPAAINPYIVSKSLNSNDRKQEGCLSFPGELAKVRRSWMIRLAFQDFEGNQHERSFVGWTARVIQHEMDHLDGKTII